MPPWTADIGCCHIENKILVLQRISCATLEGINQLIEISACACAIGLQKIHMCKSLSCASLCRSAWTISLLFSISSFKSFELLIEFAMRTRFHEEALCKAAPMCVQQAIMR